MLNDLDDDAVCSDVYVYSAMVSYWLSMAMMFALNVQIRSSHQREIRNSL